MGKTELNNAFYHGEEIVNDSDNNIYSNNGIYTSCELDHPHYYFASKKMKMVPENNIKLAKYHAKRANSISPEHNAPKQLLKLIEISEKQLF